MTRWEKEYGSEPSEVSFSLRFAGIIRRAHELTGQRVVILVDEYDKPMLQAIGNEELQREFRNTLKPFYGALKTMDGDIKFALLTGVTKFGKVSVFSDLNNLNDISMDERYVALCGMTEEEIHHYFEDDIHQLASTQGLTYEETCGRLKESYDGYHFVENSEGIYNPFSVLNTFDKMKFGSYWFETGTPTYLVELLKQNHYNQRRGVSWTTDANGLNDMDDNLISALYQNGYLTIKNYDLEFGIYTLGTPNREVKEWFDKY